MKKKILFFLLTFFCFALPALAKISYVKQGGTGSGTSWATASADLQAIISGSAAGDQIWVAKGMYQPASGQSFTMKEGVAIYGGFIGNETSLAARNRLVNVTTLQGNGSRVINNSSNSLTNAAILDGFTVTGGDITGDFGGGIYNAGSSPTITNCTFSNNVVNSAGGGGGIYNSSCNPIITNCIFAGNTVTAGGGGMTNQYSSPTITNCVFSGNTVSGSSGSGGGMSNFSSSPTITYCTFSGNTAGGSGGGMLNSGSSPNISNCTFSGNNTGAYGSGGGMMNVYQSLPNISNCTFSGNKTGAYGEGGGMSNFYRSLPNISNCTFSGNTSTYGGGMANLTSSPTVTGCIFSANTTDNVGGGMWNATSSQPIITNCLFSGNKVTFFGGGMDNDSSSPHITNCTFSGNNASNSGGGLSNYDHSSPIITNSIIYGNTDAITNGDGTNTIAITYSIVQGDYPGTGNSSGDPAFTNAPDASTAPFTDGDYSLQGTSAAINVGSNSAYPGNLNTSLDLAGNPRLFGTIIDMGVYEYQHAPAVVSHIKYVTVSGTGDGSSWANASSDLQSVINNSPAGNQVWVAAGTYQPATNGSVYSMKEGVAIYGGFVGNETALAARNWATHITVLHGNGNSVISNSNLTNAAVLDGFTITGGSGGGSGGGMYNFSASPNILNCIFSGNSAIFGGGMGNLGSSPNITNCLFSGNVGTFGGGLYNSGSSPNIANCNFAGNKADNNGGGISNYYSSSPIISNSIIYGNYSIFNDSISNADATCVPIVTYSIVQGGYTGTGNSGSDPVFTNAPSYTTAPFTGGDYSLKGISPAINTGNNGAYPGILATDLDLAHNPRLYGTIIDVGAYEYQHAPTPPPVNLPIRYVKQNGTGDGASWVNASGDFQAMIDASKSGNQVWVAKGTYQPATIGNSFSMKDSVAIYGGFAGNETSVSARNFVANVTFLQGNGNKVINNNNNGLTLTAILDGFTITGGNITNDNGGGMANNFASPTITNCSFLNNTVNTSGGGGGIFNYSSNPNIYNCVFSGNTVAGAGGGITNQSSSPTIANCIFSGNTANGLGGGGIYNVSSSSPKIINCLFSGNTVNVGGGGILNYSSSPKIVNSTFSGNLSANYGGGIGDFSSSSPNIANSVVYGNSGKNGSGIYDDGSGTSTVTYSLAQGLPADAANHNLDGSIDPLFMNAPDAAGAPFTSGNYRLQPNSVAIDAGNNSGYVGNLFTDLDLGGGPRLLGSAIDMGAYENKGLYTVLPLNGSLNENLTSTTPDSYTVTTNADGLLRLTLKAVSPADLYVTLYDNDGTTVLSSSQESYNNSTATVIIDGLAPGNYKVKITAYGNNYGAYTISDSLFTTPLANDAEPNGTAATAVTLAQDGSATGHVGYYYNHQRDSTDWYKVTTTADGLLRVYVNTQQGSVYSTTGTNPLDVNVWLYDGDGATQLGYAEVYNGNGPANNLITADGLAPGTYYIKVKCYSPNSQFANYTLSDSLFTAPVANDAEPNGTAATAVTLAQDGSATGHVGYHYSNQRDSTDWYKVTTTADGLLRVYVNTQQGSVYSTTGTNPLDVNVWLYDGDGATQLGYAEVYNGNGPANNLITADGLAPGTYYIKVKCYSPNSQFANYTLSDSLFTAPVANDAEPNGTAATAVTLAQDGSATGHVGYYYNHQRDSTDWYKVTTTADGLLRVYLNAQQGSVYSTTGTNPLDVNVWLYDGDGATQLGYAEVYNGNGPANNLITADGLAPGTYYIKVQCYSPNSQFANYTLSDSLFTAPVANDAEPNGTAATAVTLAQDGSATGHVGYYYNHQRDSTDWYKVTTTADGLLRVYVNTQQGSVYSTTGTNPLDVNVWLYDGDGATQLGYAEVYNGNGPANNLITADGLAPGTYYIKVQCYSPNSQFANYTLSDSLFTAPVANDAEPNGTSATAIVLAQNGSATGHVGYHYSNQRDSTDWYKVTTTADGLLRVYLNTQQGSVYSTTGTNPLDVNVWLYDGDGATQLGYAEVYNGNGPANNLITADGLAPGTYYIKVKCYSPNSQFANYTLSDSLFEAKFASDAEPNGNIAVAVTLPFNSSLKGHIGYRYNNQIDVDDYYKVTVSGGPLYVYLSSDRGSAYSSNTLDMLLTVYNADGTTSIGTKEVFKSNGPAVDSLVFPSVPAGDYYIRVTDYSPSSEFGVYSLSASSTQGSLPVTYLYFNGKLVGGQGILNWATATESNNKGFNVERSPDAINFTTIGFVPGSGNSNAVKTYTYTDLQPLAGKNFYRLKQIDIDGKFTYSNIVVLANNNKPLLTIYPNPASNTLFATTASFAGDIQVRDILGRLMVATKITGDKTTIDISSLASGTYYCIVGGLSMLFVKAK